MAIRLLTAWDIYPINAIVTLNPPTEAGLIEQGQAEADITGGEPYTGPAGEHQTVDQSSKQ